MTDFGDSLVSDSPSDAHTLSQLHLRAERRNVRQAVLQHHAAGKWQETPPWRFYRHVIRIGLYLRERLGVGLGDRVVLLSPLGPERVIAEWAAVVQGAVIVGLDPDLPPATIAASLGQLTPKAVFVAGPSQRARVLDVQGQPVGAERIIAFDSVGAEPAGDDGASAERSWSEVLDLGGTLDTAERAQKFRARARAVEPDAPAVGLAENDGSGSMAWRYISHGELVGQIARFRLRSPSREGDLAYVVGDKLSLPALVALWAFVGDGQTKIAFGIPGREAEQIAELRPHRIMAPRDILERAVRGGPAHSSGRPAIRTWLSGRAGARALLRRVPALAPLTQWIRPAAGQDPIAGDRLREMITLDGTRVEPKSRTTGDAR
jgi:hypothetical protein